jgi:hypothetical protein
MTMFETRIVVPTTRSAETLLCIHY